MKISEKIFELMKMKNISPYEFCKRSNIAYSTVSNWKTKKTNPAANKIMIICEVLECTPYDILTGND